MTDPLPVPDDLRHALLDIEDRIARLQDLLHLIAMAGEGLEPPHAAAIAQGIQLAQSEAGEIRGDVMRASRLVKDATRRQDLSPAESS